MSIYLSAFGAVSELFDVFPSKIQLQSNNRDQLINYELLFVNALFKDLVNKVVNAVVVFSVS